MTEPQRAKAWRQSLSLTRQALATLTGYSPEAIQRFEIGTTSRGDPHPSPAWRRYKIACLGVRFLLPRKQSPDDWNWT